MNAAGNSLFLGKVYSVSCYKNRITYSQGYLYGQITLPGIPSIYDT